MNKYNLSQITKVLEKIFKAGFQTEKDILNIKLDDLTRIQDVNGNEIIILLDLKKAIKNRQIIAFLSNSEETKGGKKMNNYEFNVNLYEKMKITVVAENEEEARRILKDTLDSITVKDIKDKLSKNIDVEIKESKVVEQVSLNRNKDRGEER